MSKNIDIANILSLISEGESPETISRLATKLASEYPEKAARLAKELKLKEEFTDVNVFITSARELTSQQKNKIEKHFTTAYGKLHFTYALDPSILGGIIFKKGEKVINNSLAFRTRELATKLKSANLIHEAK